MKQIRNNVFETNSSSTHVLCLNKNMLKEKHILGMNFTKEEKYPDDIWDNYLLELSDEFANMSFDTEWIDYSKYIQSPYQKLRYIYTYCMNKGIYWLDAFAEILKKIGEVYEIKIAIADEDVDKSKYVNERKKYIYENDYVINHESSDCLDKYINSAIKNAKLFKPKLSDILFDIITKPKYIIFNWDYGIEEEWFKKNNIKILNREVDS